MGGVHAVVLDCPVLDMELHRVGVALDHALAGAVLHADVVGNRDRGQDPDDHHDDHELDQGETLPILQHSKPPLSRSLEFRPARGAFSVFR